MSGDADTPGNDAGVQLSEVFWSGAKTTTCFQQHPRVAQLKTSLEFQYKFENNRVYIKTLRYKMSTRYGNWYRGNIDVVLKGQEEKRVNSPDTMSQDEQWHDHEVLIDIPFTDPSILPLVNIRVDYDGTNNDVEPHEGWGTELKLARMPLIESPTVIETELGKPVLISGRGGLTGALMYVYYRVGDNYEQSSFTGNSKPDGSWSLSVVMPANRGFIVVAQHVGLEVSSYSETILINSILMPPDIYHPAAGQEILVSNPILSGRGRDGSTVQVWQTNPQRTLVKGAIVKGNVWSQQSEVELERGSVTIRAKATLEGITSRDTGDRTFMVKGPFPLAPTITNPNPAINQDLTFTIGGKNGEAGAFVKVLLDLLDNEVGRSATLSGDAWSASVQVPAGRHSLVAQQIRGSEESDRSAPVAYKIRPPVPEVKVDFGPPPGTVRFYGETGYNGATVQVIIVTGPVGTPPPMVVVNKNNWSTTASGWPYGNYEVNVIQKVPGGASDWIESIPSEHKFTVSVSPPTAACEVNERIPTFFGTGISNATISITDHQGNPVGAGTTTVSGGTWSVTATSAWPPVKDRIIWVVQKVDVHTSQPFVLNVTIDPLETPTDVAYRIEAYQPVFFGIGVVGATVYIQDENGVDVAQPLFLSTTAWTIPAKDIWGPTSPARKIHVLQKKDGFSSERVTLDVFIALLAPEITEIIDVAAKDLHVRVQGTGWSGAQVTLTFSDSGTGHLIDVREGNWAFERTTPFVPATVHTATAIQKFGGQSSPAASKTFEARLPAPTITYPGVNDDEWRDLTVIGGKGYKGASMQIWDAQYVLKLGNPKILDADGVWSINLIGLDLRTTEIKAIQSFNSRDSLASNIIKFNVTVLPPQITVPIEGGHLPRISTLSGKGVKGAMVTVWLQGESEPLLNQVLVNDQGIWSGTVILPIGAKVIRCQQRFANITSKDSPLRTYDVVPASPVIETPVAGEHVGRRVVVSGFGVQGDSVRVALGSAANPIRQSSPVLEDRTWSVTLEIDHPGGEDTLQAFASCDGFTSVAAERALLLGTYQPSIDLPAPGQWVSQPVVFSGQGRPGVGQVASWFNPEQVWVPNVAVTAAGWQGEAQQTLPPGGQWCRFRQTLTDGADGATSDWVDSGRFESEPPAT